ncbi:MAG TPA: TRAP transporter small permease [Rubrivivax sp.]|nr:TRAP transporter small permease [Burkholderiales bacterium]HNT40362.1 TRAP transporter small permease [Rubrivivax sp.]
MNALRRLSAALNKAVELLLMLIGAVICVILFAQVVYRYAGDSLGWSEEVSRHLLVAITFLGGSVAYKRANFIGLQGIGHRFGPAFQRLVVLLLQWLTLACFGLIAWFGTAYTLKAAEHTSASLQIPMSIPYAVIPLSALVFIVHVLADMTGAPRRDGP